MIIFQKYFEGPLTKKQLISNTLLQVNFFIFITANMLVYGTRNIKLTSAIFVYLSTVYFFAPFIFPITANNTRYLRWLNLISLPFYWFCMFRPHLRVFAIAILGILFGMTYSALFYFKNNSQNPYQRNESYTKGNIYNNALLLINLLAMSGLHRFLGSHSIYWICFFNTLVNLVIYYDYDSRPVRSCNSELSFDKYLLVLIMLKAVTFQKYFLFLLLAEKLVEINELFLIISPVTFFFLTPFLSGFMNHLRKARREPSIDLKILTALSILSAGFILVRGLNFYNLALFYVLLTVSDILAESAVTVAIHKKSGSQKYFLFSNGLAGAISGLSGYLFLQYSSLNSFAVLAILILFTIIIFSILTHVKKKDV
ncbi:MAG: hypothetical protein JXQ65_05715 [Candidatus Marinimicrobia bacterium]|nr:hypothetical protein [Candidatus Neomarinimicrobiota bacterium]